MLRALGDGSRPLGRAQAPRARPHQVTEGRVWQMQRWPIQQSFARSHKRMAM
jgi:hypothetical protein